MRGLILTLLLLTATICAGQSYKLSDKEWNDSGAKRLSLEEDTAQAVELAKLDISKGRPILLLQGGIAPIIYLTDRDFEKKFKVYFYDWGCVGPEEKISSAYNFQTFEYLTRRFGTRWIRDIRKDVIGLREWRKMKGK